MELISRSPYQVPLRIRFKEKTATEILALGAPPSGHGYVLIKDNNNLTLITDTGREIRITNKTHLMVVDNSGNQVTDSVGNYVYSDGSI